MANSRVYTMRGNNGGVSGVAYITESEGIAKVTLKLREKAPDSDLAVYLICRTSGKRNHIRIERVPLDGDHYGYCSAEGVCGVVVAAVRENREDYLCNGAGAISAREMNAAMTEIRLRMAESKRAGMNAGLNAASNKKSKPQNVKLAEAVTENGAVNAAPAKESLPAPRVLRAGEAYSERKSKEETSRIEAQANTNDQGDEPSKRAYQNRSAVIGNILEQATRLFGGLPGSFSNATVETAPQKETELKEDTPIADTEQEAIPNPFPKSFPNSYWKRKRNHPQLFGKANVNGEFYSIIAVEGKKANRPPRYLRGFNRYLRSYEGKGYWLSIKKES